MPTHNDILRERRFKKAFHLAINNFEKAGFKIKDCYFDDYLKALELKEKNCQNAKDVIDSDIAIADLIDTIDEHNHGFSDYVHNHLDDHMPYSFTSPYVVFYFPEDAIIIPVIANNLPSIMELQIVQEVTDDDFAHERDMAVNYKRFIYNHSGRRPVLALSIIESLIDQYNPDQYLTVRTEFFNYFYELSKEVLESYTQWTTMMDLLSITEKNKHKEVNIDLTKSDNTEEKKKENKEDGENQLQ